MNETTPKRPGRKRLSKDGVIMSERVSMSCTPEEVELLQVIAGSGPLIIAGSVIAAVIAGL